MKRRLTMHAAAALAAMALAGCGVPREAATLAHAAAATSQLPAGPDRASGAALGRSLEGAGNGEPSCAVPNDLRR